MTLLDRIRRWSKGEKPPSKSLELPPLTKAIRDIPACYVCYALDGEVYATSLIEYLGQHRIAVFSNEIEDEFWGEEWVARIRDARASTGPLILIATQDALRSKRVLADLEYFYKHGWILPIMFDGVTKVDDVPYALRGAPWLVEKKLALTMGPSPETVTALLSAIQDFERYAPKNRIIIPQERDEKRPLNEGKLILVGRGEVGKTSLVRRLVDNNFRGDESKTQGINITSWSLLCDSDTFRLNIWDFGGQEIMHATHQFFLTEQSIYLLVLNGREGGEDLDAEYWLKHIESFGGNSPVLLVQNKIRQHPFELNYRGLQARYPQIRGFVKTDCRESIGLKELREAIEAVVRGMPEIRMQFPSDWFTVKERLESMEDEYMGYEEFRQLCQNEGIEDDSDQNTLRWVLHCLGIALNYRDDSRLRDTSVLKPEWLAERQGELDLKDLQQLLPKDRYPSDKHLFLLELMRKFSLCFPFPDEPDRYLVPELLGKEQPEETTQFPPRDCLNFEYHYGILPEGLMPRFIVRSHTLSRGQQRWRSGVILAHEDCQGLVTAEYADRRVIVRVKGENAGARRRLLALIRYDLDRIHAEFKDRLDAQPKVPLTEFPEFSVDYKKLVALEKQAVATFPEVIDERVITVQVDELLNGVDLEHQRKDSLKALAQAKAIFFSYSHKDESLRDELETHLKLLQRQGIISVWHDRKILPGTEWDGEIDVNLERAKIILLLISADFIASDYCWDKEVKRALERHEKDEAVVLPIALRKCDWKGAPFSKLQGLPKDLTPVTSYKDRDAAWTDVATGIRAVAENI
jgi:internalin A